MWFKGSWWQARASWDDQGQRGLPFLRRVTSTDGCLGPCFWSQANQHLHFGSPYGVNLYTLLFSLSISFLICNVEVTIVLCTYFKYIVCRDVSLLYWSLSSTYPHTCKCTHKCTHISTHVHTHMNARTLCVNLVDSKRTANKVVSHAVSTNISRVSWIFSWCLSLFIQESIKWQ